MTYFNPEITDSVYDSVMRHNMESIIFPGRYSLVSMSFSIPTCSANAGTSVVLFCSPTFFIGFSACHRTFSLAMWGRWQKYCTTHLTTRSEQETRSYQEKSRSTTAVDSTASSPDSCPTENIFTGVLMTIYYSGFWFRQLNIIRISASHHGKQWAFRQWGILTLYGFGHSKSIKVQKETISE